MYIAYLLIPNVLKHFAKFVPKTAFKEVTAIVVVSRVELSKANCCHCDEDKRAADLMTMEKM